MNQTHQQKETNRSCLFQSLILLTSIFTITATAQTYADIIPIEEEFVLTQQLHVDSSWNAITHTVQEETGLLDKQSIMHYEGAFDISIDAAGDYIGTYSGTLTGEYLGETWEISYNSTMETVLVGADTKDKKFTLTSSGKWMKGDYGGKTFTDSGSLTEKSTNKADMDIEITTKGETSKITTTATDLNKTKKDGKLTLKGNIKVKDKNGKETKLDLTFVLDQSTKKFTSLAEYGLLGTDVLKNTGSYTVTEKPQNQGYTGTTTFDIMVTPEPNTILLLSIVGLIVARKR